jgi:DNA-binding HxlR family transcriptional regulator
MRYNENICVRYQHAIEMLSKRWTALILKVMLSGPLRFSELADQLGVVSDRMLSERLKDLEQQGVVERRVFPETPVRVEYSLTAKGQALAPVIEAIETWGNEWVELETDSVDEHTHTEEAVA